MIDCLCPGALSMIMALFNGRISSSTSNQNNDGVRYSLDHNNGIVQPCTPLV